MSIDPRLAARRREPAAPRRRAAGIAADCLTTMCLTAAAVAAACSGASGAPVRTDVAPAPNGHLFTRMPSSYTGVRFVNRVTDTQASNVFTYRNHYNGGGVALGDLTGDGLPEIVMTGNEDGAHLYLNEGKFRFRDVTEEAGITNGSGAWTTGVTIADVNGDGRLDLYVCHAGNDRTKPRANQLFINQGLDAHGVPTFKDEARAYGLADGGYATQAVFLDYDHDGDLDLFLIRNSPRPVTSFGLRNTRAARDSLGGAKLYRNDSTPGHPHFADVSAAAGIYSPEIAFGLGVGVGDVDRDGWPDLYVSNDFFERDYLYLNNHDGTFREVLDRAMPYLSYFSMGMDIADVNNDGWPDVYTTDMLPEGERRIKETSAAEGWDSYHNKLRNNYHHQLMRNMLQLNNGVRGWAAPAPSADSAAASWPMPRFSDVGQIAGVARTDWSWSALMVDLDLDGFKDVFVTNGIAKDVTSQDYINSMANQQAVEAYARGGLVDYMGLTAAMPSTKLANFAFHNLGPEGGAAAGRAGVPVFSSEAESWGLATPSQSSGAAYGDLDGDGAPDLVVSNFNEEAFVYRNDVRAVHPERHYLAVRLDGTGMNRFGVGAKVSVRAGWQLMYQELSPTRGFQSSSDYTLLFGTGTAATADSVTVEWPDGRVNAMAHVATNQRLTVRAADAVAATTPLGRAALDPDTARTLFADVTAQVRLDWAHRENDFVDFDRDRLTPKMLSTEGPAVAVADVNGDGLDDLYLGGAKEQPGVLMLQTPDGRFVRSNPGLFEQDAISEDVGATFFDANGDGRPDLYVVSGGSEYSADSPGLQDRLYLNDGGGRFHKATGALPAETVSGSRVVAADYDGDGAVDLFVGGRSVPWQYGVPARSLLLKNDGRGHFTDVTDRVAPALSSLGMVTDAAWRDVDGDGRADLVVVGEWMRVTVFHNGGSGQLTKVNAPGLEQSAGWYNRVVAGDFGGAGHADLLLANLGLNTRLHATPREPATMLVKDFDHNGYTEQILSCYNGGRSYPITLRDDLLKALPYLKAHFPNYHSYAGATVDTMFTAAEQKGAVFDTAMTFATAIARNDGHGRFTLTPLPREAQLAPVYGVLVGDFDGDGHPDLLLGGNFDGVRPDIGRMAASYGLYLRGDGRGGYLPVPGRVSGFVVPGQTRDIVRVRTRGGPLILVARNDDRPLLFRAVPAPAARQVAHRAPARREAVARHVADAS